MRIGRELMLACDGVVAAFLASSGLIGLVLVWFLPGFLMFFCFVFFFFTLLAWLAMVQSGSHLIYRYCCRSSIVLCALFYDRDRVSRQWGRTRDRHAPGRAIIDPPTFHSTSPSTITPTLRSSSRIQHQHKIMGWSYHRNTRRSTYQAFLSSRPWHDKPDPTQPSAISPC